MSIKSVTQTYLNMPRPNPRNKIIYKQSLGRPLDLIWYWSEQGISENASDTFHLDVQQGPDKETIERCLKLLQTWQESTEGERYYLVCFYQALFLFYQRYYLGIKDREKQIIECLDQALQSTSLEFRQDCLVMNASYQPELASSSYLEAFDISPTRFIEMNTINGEELLLWLTNSWKEVPQSEWMMRLQPGMINLNATNVMGQLVLLIAILNHNEDLLEQLLNLGADPYFSVGTGNSAMSYAWDIGNWSLCEKFIKRYPPDYSMREELRKHAEEVFYWNPHNATEYMVDFIIDLGLNPCDEVAFAQALYDKEWEWVDVILTRLETGQLKYNEVARKSVRAELNEMDFSPDEDQQQLLDKLDFLDADAQYKVFLALKELSLIQFDICIPDKLYKRLMAFF